MDKNTKLILGLGLVGVGAYLLWKKGQGTKASANGDFFSMRNPGRRMRMSGKMNASGLKGLKMKKSFAPGELPVKDSGWQGADGFKKTKKEKVFKSYAGAGAGKFFKVKDSGWQG